MTFSLYVGSLARFLVWLVGQICDLRLINVDYEMDNIYLVAR